MTSRTITGQTVQNFTWDESSRLEQITRGTTTTGFLYDADGSRVARRDNGVTTVMIDNTFEWSSAGGLVSYYTHAVQVIAMRNTTGLHWIFGDHLGSASTVRTPAGTNLRQRYLPFGRVRGAAGLPTEYGYTGQRLDPTGLMDYNARQYDPILGRFTGYDELGKPGSGVFRSADETRQFRIDNGSITGTHSPGVPHTCTLRRSFQAPKSRS